MFDRENFPAYGTGTALVNNLGRAMNIWHIYWQAFSEKFDIKLSQDNIGIS